MVNAEARLRPDSLADIAAYKHAHAFVWRWPWIIILIEFHFRLFAYRVVLRLRCGVFTDAVAAVPTSLHEQALWYSAQTANEATSLCVLDYNPFLRLLTRHSS